MARILLLILLLLPLARPALPETPVDVRLQYIERDLDRLRQEIGTRPEMERLQRLEAEIAGVRAALKETEKAATDGVKEKLDAQDKRIGDLSLVLADGANKISVSSYLATWASVLITLSLFIVTAFTALRVPEQAKEAAREKAEEISDRTVERAQKEASRLARESADMEAARALEHWLKTKAEPALAAIISKAQEQLEKHQEIITSINQEFESRSLNSIEEKYPPTKNDSSSIKIENKNKAIELIKLLTPTMRTAEQWRALIFSFINQKSFEAALSCAEEWLATPNQTTEQTALALRTKGVVLSRAGRNLEAISIYDEVIQRFDRDTLPALRKHVAGAFLNKGVVLSSKQPEDAISAFDEVIRRFDSDSDQTLREEAAWALLNKSYALISLKKHELARATCEDYLKRFANADEPAIQKITEYIRATLNTPYSGQNSSVT